VRSAVLASSVLFLVAACQTTAPVGNYAAFYESQPVSILVLPVVNETTAAEAPDAFSSTITRPLLKRGYYVFPVQPTLEILRSEGVVFGGQLEDIDPRLFHEVLGTDAVLYTTLHSWDTHYLVLASGVQVAMTYRLVDARTGQTLWEDHASRQVSSDSGGGSLLAAMISAAVTAATTDYVPLARQASDAALRTLPAGPLSPRFEDEKKLYLDREARRKKSAKTEVVAGS
jgi:hypothetical protein